MSPAAQHPRHRCLFHLVVFTAAASSLCSLPRVEAGRTPYQKFRSFLTANGYASFYRALDSSTYGSDLDKLMQNKSVTVLIPRDPTLPSQYQNRSLKFAKQIYSLHVLIGNGTGVLPASSLLSSATGTAFLTADLYPPAPKPLVPIWRLNSTGDALFNGTLTGKTGARIIAGDVYKDGLNVLAHVVDGIMIPAKFFM